MKVGISTAKFLPSGDAIIRAVRNTVGLELHAENLCNPSQQDHAERAIGLMLRAGYLTIIAALVTILLERR